MNDIDARQHVTDDDAYVGTPAWSAVAAVGCGIFALVTTELLPVGLLTPVSAALDVSAGTAGLMVTVPGVVAALSAPLVALLAGRTDRRTLLCGLMALLAAANLLSAWAPGFAPLLAARVLVGISIGGFWMLAGGLAFRLVPAPDVGRAMSIIFGGVAVASVLGVPLGTLLGELGGWRSAFVVMGALSAVILLALLALLPRLSATHSISCADLLGASRIPAVRAGIIATFCLVTGHFSAYTFVRPVLQDLAGIEASLMGPLLFTYGTAGVVANFLAGPAAARNVRRTLLRIVAMLTAVLFAMAAFGSTTLPAIIVLLMWGLSYGGASVSLQSWMNQAAPHATEAVSAVFSGMFNFSIALGALIGGVAIDSAGPRAVLILGAVLVFGAGFCVRSAPLR